MTRKVSMMMREIKREMETMRKRERETEMGIRRAVRVNDSPTYGTRKSKAASTPPLFEVGEKKTRGGAKKK